MSDLIKLLPESIANQIAAGEVIQRPASVVKELMENAIDAGGTSITLVIRNSGKTLIHVLDNGKGMSETDARMSFERHATSKIRTAQDLFNIRTMGFRGEALASIASIAEVEMKTRPADVELGNHIVIKSSQIITQGFCQTEPGTSIAVKNLFFNVPARKKFLKSDSVEMKKILDEFQRIALAHPELKFRVIHNDNEVYNLPQGTLLKRILGLFRKSYEEKLIKVGEETTSVNLDGYIGNPDIARKQKGEQFIFVNKRFIKSNYLNHAMKSAYENLIGEDHYPFFILFLEVDPDKIDINVHPTKQEINFDDERIIYNYVKVATKHALGRYSLSPQLDFENENSAFKAMRRPLGNGGSENIPSGINSSSGNPQASRLRSAPMLRNWQNLYAGENIDLEEDNSNEEPLIMPSAASGNLLTSFAPIDNEEKVPVQLHKSYIMVQIRNGYIIMDQHLAHTRILYEKYLHQLNQRKELIQKQLFPITLQLNKSQVITINEIEEELRGLGFEIEPFGGDTYIVQGIPAGMTDRNIENIIHSLIDSYNQNISLELSKNENIARSMAESAATTRNKSLSKEEMRSLIDELFACEMPYVSPSGKKCFISYELSDLEKQFS